MLLFCNTGRSAAHKCSFVKLSYRKNLLALAILLGQRVNTKHRKFVIVWPGTALGADSNFAFNHALYLAPIASYI